MTHDRPLVGRVALVTGSTSGIGLGIAEALAAAGAAIAFNGFGEPQVIDGLVGGVRDRHGARAGHYAADLAHSDEVTALIGRVEQDLGNIDILVNNAGIQHVANVEDFPDDRWDAVLAINLSSNFHAIKAALPAMKRRNWGRIINIASAHGLVASAGKCAYVAAKHGVIGLTKAVALETARTGVTVNAICPGWVRTPLVDRQIQDRAQRMGTSVEDAALGLLGDKQPSLEFVTPEQVGALAVFLCGEAAAQIRGAAYSIDGGWVAQ